MPGVDDPERVKKLNRRANRSLALMKIVSPPNPAPVQTYPTKEAALQSIGGSESLTARVLPYADRDDRAAPNAAESAEQQPKQYCRRRISGDR